MTHNVSPFPTWFKVHRWPWIVVGLGAVLATGCAEVSEIVLRQEGSTAVGDVAVLREAPLSSFPDMAPESAPPVPESDMGQGTPQLVKRASLELMLSNLDGAREQVQTLVNQVNGDVLSLRDHRAPDGTAQHLTVTLRVPQAQLEPLLQELRALGTVQQQSLTADDVSSQLVDLEARLKNLRQAEAALLGIMERSGEISHVLEVARELSTVRESIERLAAQQQNLQWQVAYAHIQLSIQSPVSALAPLRPARETLGHTWQTATQSVKAFTIGGLRLSLWLLAYSPYGILLAAMTYGGYRLWLSRWPRALVTDPVATDSAVIDRG
jgi:hypothetical protein